MILLAASAAAGALFLHQTAHLPPWPWAALVVLAMSLALYPPVRLPAGFLLGFAWAGMHGQVWLERAVPEALTGAELVVVGSIDGIPDHAPRRSRFVLKVESVEDAPADFRAQRLRVTLFPPAPELSAGDRLRVSLRIRPARGLHNPSGFDFGSWLYREGIHGLATVRGRPELLPDVGSGQPLQTLRVRVRDGMLAALPGAAHPGVMQALVIGERGAMRAEEWRRFLHTGTNHLMAISGLHVGLVAGFALLLARAFWRRAAWLRGSISLALFGAAVAMAAATLYAALAGFAIPTQRALIMLVLVSGALLVGRDPLSWRVYAAALLVVIAIHPANVLAPGFWFSFGAVAVILLLVQGRVASPGLRGWLALQAILALALLPLSLAWFDLGAWIAPVANLVAVPTISFLVLPALLLGAGLALVWAPLAMPLLWWADFWLAQLLWLLELLLRLPAAASEMAVPGLAALLAGAAVGLLLMPRAWRLLPLAGVLGLALFLPVTPRLAEGDFRAEMLDVGQGLAMVVRTRQHALVYDAGPAWEGGLNSGSAVVLPALRRLGVRAVDVVMVSHEHMDHRGGVTVVTEALQVRRTLSRRGGPGLDEEACEKGLEWEWDGVRFRTLHPPPFWDDGNAGSCVLVVQGPHGSLLLTGDIEGIGESVLVRSMDGELQADVLVVPHHGASGVLSRGLLDAVTPRVAWVSRGYDNRFGHPAADVVARLEGRCIALFDTAERGMLWLETDSQGIRLGRGSRVERMRFWQPRVDADVALPARCPPSISRGRLVRSAVEWSDD